MNRTLPMPYFEGNLAFRLRKAGADFSANANVSAHVIPGDLERMEAEVALHYDRILEALGIDVAADPHMRRTSERVAKMYVREVFAGRYEPQPDLTDFPNAAALDELYTVGPIAIRSTCAHHLCPIDGFAWVGVVPSERIIGLSKFSRLARWVFSRPQMQEEATVQLADVIEQAIKPIGLGVVVKAKHACMTWRGVLETETTMASSVLRGALRKDASARAEFLDLIAGQRFQCR